MKEAKKKKSRERKVKKGKGWRCCHESSLSSRSCCRRRILIPHSSCTRPPVFSLSPTTTRRGCLRARGFSAICLSPRAKYFAPEWRGARGNHLLYSRKFTQLFRFENTIVFFDYIYDRLLMLLLHALRNVILSLLFTVNRLLLACIKSFSYFQLESLLWDKLWDLFDYASVGCF